MELIITYQQPRTRWPLERPLSAILQRSALPDSFIHHVAEIATCCLTHPPGLRFNVCATDELLSPLACLTEAARVPEFSSVATNFKVGGHTSGAENFFNRAPPTFFGSTSTICRFGERFRDGQYSLVSFLFSVLLFTVSPVPRHLQKWGHVPPRAQWSRRHCV